MRRFVGLVLAVLALLVSSPGVNAISSFGDTFAGLDNSYVTLPNLSYDVLAMAPAMSIAVSTYDLAKPQEVAPHRLYESSATGGRQAFLLEANAVPLVLRL